MVSQEVPQIIIDLVENFKENEHIYKSANYDEENTKVEFINPFFEALGWDVNNKNRASPRFKEVVFEDTIKIGGKAKAPDYSFRLGGQRIFFVEAKKPSVNIDTDKNPAYQIRRYGWSAKLPLCILTDFEELAVYETTTRPDKNQNASIGRIKYYKYTEYIDKWDEIYNIFSKEAVLSGKFDNYADNTKGIKKGTSEVDNEFLKEIDRWRELLARNIALRNPEVSIEELNHAVQLTIDRIIFLRMAEDRGIEKYQQLKNLIELSSKNKDEYAVYEGFLEICRKADAKYNSGLFHFTEEKEISLDADNLTPHLKIDDKVFKDILAPMYYPDCPYEFSVISPEILGNVYERFLGKEIRLTKSHQAKIDVKPEVRKAGGVFYTPQYIVKYIVQKTVGELIKDKTPKQVSKLRFLDPACGSGSFLLEIYQYLLDWHLDYYSNLERVPKDVIFVGKDGLTRLTINEKKRIVLNNIYGVDIDSQAVEVTKLSLLLKVLEDQNKDVVEQQQKLFQERALPYLGDNIRCGNSLIGTDILEKEDLTIEEISKINPFDWEDEFDEVFENGGFDVVVGNPPYGYHEIHSDITKKYLKNKFESSKGSFEHYFLFYESSLNLLKDDGIHSFIVPVTWISIPSAKSLRKYVLDNYAILELNWFNYFVFKDAKVNTLISFIKNSKLHNTSVKIFDDYNLSHPSEIRNYSQRHFINFDYSINIFEDEKDMGILEKILDNSIPMGDVAKPCSGYNPYEKGKGKAPHGGPQTKQTVKDKPYHSNEKLGEDWKLEIIGRDLSRYGLEITGDRWIKYGSWLAAPRDPENFQGIRLLVQEITGGENKRIVATYYENELYYSRDVIPVKVDDKSKAFLILGIINSNLITWYHHKRNPKSQKALFPKILVSDLKKIPLPNKINWGNINESSECEIIDLVNKMLELNIQLQNVKTPKEKRLLEKQIDVTDKKINQLVYELYDLIDDEIEVIENSLK